MVLVPDQIVVAVIPKINLYGFRWSKGWIPELLRILENDGAMSLDRSPGSMRMQVAWQNEPRARRPVSRIAENLGDPFLPVARRSDVRGKVKRATAQALGGALFFLAC